MHVYTLLEYTYTSLVYVTYICSVHMYIHIYAYKCICLYIFQVLYAYITCRIFTSVYV